MSSPSTTTAGRAHPPSAIILPTHGGCKSGPGRQWVAPHFGLFPLRYEATHPSSCLFIPLANPSYSQLSSAAAAFPRQTCRLSGRGGQARPPLPRLPSFQTSVAWGTPLASRFFLAYGKLGWHRNRHLISAAFSQPQLGRDETMEIQIETERSEARRRPPSLGPGTFLLFCVGPVRVSDLPPNVEIGAGNADP